MTRKANDKQQIENERERRRLRFTLLKDILRYESVRALSSDHKKLFFRLLANGWSITDTPPDTSRIRALKKVASDAHRLWSALNGLDPKDKDSLDFNYRQTIPLSTRQVALQELEHDAAALSRIIKGEQAAIARLQRKKIAARLVNTLRMFEIPCSTRNDSDVAERYITIAMRCVMFSMLEENAKKLSWGTTASIIKLGVQVLTDQNKEKVVFSEGPMTVSTEEAEAVRLWMLEEPIWNSLTLDA